LSCPGIIEGKDLRDAAFDNLFAISADGRTIKLFRTKTIHRLKTTMVSYEWIFEDRAPTQHILHTNRLVQMWKLLKKLGDMP
jgi:hypothetical protein